MANSSKTLSLTILEREYRINCPQGAELQLKEAAEFLNSKMLEIKNAGSSAGKVVGVDRIAVIAALNISHQLLELQQQQHKQHKELEHINHRLDEAIALDLQREL